LKQNFKIDELWTSKKYTKALIVGAGARVFIIRPLKHWQIDRILKLLMVYKNELTLDALIKDVNFYPALAYIFSDKNIMQLAQYLSKNTSYKQILTIVRVLIIQNDLLEFKKIYESLVHNG